MSGQFKNGLLLGAVLLLTIIPLLTVKPSLPGPDSESAPIFSGSDTQAEGVIQNLNPDYRPWFNSLFQPPGSEIESLLFALQAALGAGIIGYYAGYVRGRKSTAPPSPDAADRAH